MLDTLYMASLIKAAGYEPIKYQPHPAIQTQACLAVQLNDEAWSMTFWSKFLSANQDEPLVVSDMMQTGRDAMVAPFNYIIYWLDATWIDPQPVSVPSVEELSARHGFGIPKSYTEER